MRLKVSNVCQLYDKSKFPVTTTHNGITWTNNNDGTITTTGTANNYGTWLNINGATVTLINAHKYLLCGCPSGGATNTYWLVLSPSITGNPKDIGSGKIFTAQETATCHPLLQINPGLGDNLLWKPQLFDLTEMYGAGNEPTTVAQFRQDFPNEMYDYSPVCWKKFRRLKYVTETKNLLKLNDFSNSWLTIKNNTIRIKKTSDLQSYSNAIFSPLQTDLKSDKYYRISAKVIGEFTGRIYKFFGNSLWGNAINNNRWQFGFTLVTVEDKYGLTINQNTTTTVGCTLISDEVFIYDIMLEESDTALIDQAEYVPSGYLPLNRGKYIANKEPVQLLDKSKFPVTTTHNGITWTNNNDGTITTTGTANNYGTWLHIYETVTLINAHKYLLYGCPSGGTTRTYWLVLSPLIEGNPKDIGSGKIFTAQETATCHPLLQITPGLGDNLLWKPQLFDLTEMYGAGNEPTTVAQFRADYPNELYDYNPYNAITFH